MKYSHLDTYIQNFLIKKGNKVTVETMQFITRPVHIDRLHDSEPAVADS